MSFSTSHTESGEGARSVKQAVDRCLDWLTRAEPGNAPVRWRLTMSFKETDQQNVENEGARRTGQLFDAPKPKRGPGRPRKNPLPPALPAPEEEVAINGVDEDDE